MPRPDRAQLQAVIPRLGDAILDPGLWPEIMEEICRAVDAKGAILLQSDIRTPDVPFTESIRDLYDAYFRDGWSVREYRARGLPVLLNGTPVFTDQDFMTPDEMRAVPYYNEFVYPNRCHWFAGVGFRSGASLWIMCLQRDTRQGLFEKHEARMLAGLAQPLTEVATLSKAVGRMALASSTNALNGVRHPAIAIDHFGLVLDANPAAEAMFDDDMRVSNRRLWLADAQARASLEALLQHLIAGHHATAMQRSAVVVRRHGSPPVVLNALPVPDAARNPFLGARAILALTPLQPKPRPDAGLLALAFGLTSAEAKLASILADGTSVESAAAELSISVETARKELKNVFAKTGMHRQGELVALLSRL